MKGKETPIENRSRPVHRAGVPCPGDFFFQFLSRQLGPRGYWLQVGVMVGHG